jgi:hypothetical protein
MVTSSRSAPWVLGGGLVLRLWLRLGLLPSTLGGLHHLGLRLAYRDSLGVHGLCFLGGDNDLVLDPPAALGDAGLLADLLAEVVQLRPAHVTVRGDFQLLDLRGVQGEGSLDPDSEGLLTDRERLPGAASLALDDDSLEDLGALPVSLDHLEVHAHAVASAELRALLEDSLLEAFDDCAHPV